ncbi:MAG: DUF4366 domain-containing protein [Ruminococcus sp.]|nr:DUF4366 domain-containing protein [Ruminococcus sp.]
MKARFFSAVLAAMMLATASVGITASAEEAATEGASAVEDIDDIPEDDSAELKDDETDISAEDTSSVSDDESDDDMEKFREVMGELAEAGTTDIAPDYENDPYYDTDGNATLIKSEKIVYNSEEMQFIAVTTKDGHVFYVLINYSAKNGEDNVYFLNRVDDYDLYALLYAGAEDDEDSSKITPEQAAQAAEQANGRVKRDGGADAADTAETTASGEDSAEGDEVTAPAQPANMGSMYLLVGVIALIGVGAAGFFFMKKKNGGKSAVQVESDYDDDDTEIVENDDYPDYLDENKGDD